MGLFIPIPKQIKVCFFPGKTAGLAFVNLASFLSVSAKPVLSFIIPASCSPNEMNAGRRTLLLSKRVTFFLLATVVIVNVILIACYQFDGVLSDVHESLSRVLPEKTYDDVIAKLLKEVETNKTRFWLANTELQHVDVEIPLSNILPSTDDKQELFWDPRFTIAAYLNELSHHKDTTKVPELPFHWADWADLTSLNDKLGQRMDPRQLSCSRLRTKIRGRPNTGYFCKSSDKLSDEEVFASGFLSRAHMPEAVIYDHCRHQNPAYNDIRVFMAKSYTLTNLPKPYKVIILNRRNERGVYEFAVDQNRNPQQRLLYSGMTQNLIGNSTVTEVDGVSMLSFNHKKFFNDLTTNVSPHVLTSEEDIHSMYSIVTAKSGMKTVPLGEEMFAYTEDQVKELIAEYEKIQNRSPLQENFLAGLKECGPYNGENEPTYFKMSLLDIRELSNYKNDWGWHYDWRFFSDMLFFNKNGWTAEEHVERTNIILERLLRTWNRFAEEKGIISWIMHGPLLSWFWDGLMFPYDVDIDIQMPISELVRLSRDYNQTLVVENPEEGYGKFLIDIGSYIHNRDISSTGNHIDGRFVDVDSGIYIDITGLSKSSANLPDEYKKTKIVEKEDNKPEAEVYNDRRKHFYTINQLQPLRYTMMGGVPLFVPNKIEERLRFEYKTGLDSYEYGGWIFVPRLQLWVMKEELTKVLTDEEKLRDGKEDTEKIVDSVKSMSEDTVVKLLQSSDNILKEYYLTKKLSDWHQKEKSILIQEDGDDVHDLMENEDLRKKYENLITEVSLRPPLRMSLYEYEHFERKSHSGE